MTLIVGDITKKVRNSESPIITGLGGICCPPKACRKKDSTTTILVNDVNMISTAGRNDRKLIKRKTCIMGLLISLKSRAYADVALQSERMKMTGTINRYLAMHLPQINSRRDDPPDVLYDFFSVARFIVVMFIPPV
jgi:hypothetical protein